MRVRPEARPLPASGMMTFMVRSFLASVAVLEADDVVEMRRARFQHVAVGDGLDVVDGSRRDPERLSRLQPHVLQLVTSLHLHPVLHLPAEEIDGLVFQVVILHESDWPAFTCRILPTYRSFEAQMVSWPHGLGTVRTGVRPLMS